MVHSAWNVGQNTTYLLEKEKGDSGLKCSSQRTVVTSHPNKKHFAGDYCRMVQTKWILPS